MTTAPNRPGGITTQNAFNALGDLLDFLSTFGGTPGSGSGAPGFYSESVLFVTTAASGNVQTWRANKDGFIVGWVCSAGSQFAISVNIAAPASAPAGTAAVLPGLVWYPSAVNPASTQQGIPAGIRFPFKANDSINVTTLAVSSVTLWLYVSYPLA